MGKAEEFEEEPLDELEEAEEMMDDEEYDDEQDEESARTSDLKENAIEWYNGDSHIFVTLAQRKLINTVTKLAAKHPEEAQVLKVNADGTIYAKIPLRCLAIRWPREVTAQQREQARLRLNKYWSKDSNVAQ